MKSYKQCCSEVAIKHKLGKSLVAGHLAKYWEEAADAYANQFKVEVPSYPEIAMEAKTYGESMDNNPLSVLDFELGGTWVIREIERRKNKSISQK